MTPESSFPVDLSNAANSNKTLRYSASAGHRRVVAKRLDALEITEFKTTFVVHKKASGVYLVEGHIIARLSQACVRTLNPVPAVIDEKFEVTFMREDIIEKTGQDEGEIEDIEILGNEPVDLGEIAIQYLSLALDPFPTGKGEIEAGKPGEGVSIISEEAFREKSSPFAQLKKTPKK
ncbi:MAG: DUF177 domain-containing protein [Sphingomonadales bacterium]